MPLPIYLTTGGPFEWNAYNIICAALYLTGSFITTWSELQRKWFKQNPQNKGKLYTKGLFSITRHPNYFGDILSTTGWYGFTQNYYAVIIPLTMVLNLKYGQIPELEAYLKKRYSEQWDEYEKNVKSLVPFIW